MKGNRELDELLISYLLKELNAEEEAFVTEHINSDDKSRRQFEEFCNAWKLIALKQQLDKIDPDSEWQHFKQTIAQEKQKLVSIKRQEDLEVEIEEDKRGGNSVVRRILITIAIAASAITLMVLAWNFSGGNKQTKSQVSKLAPGKTDKPPVFVRHETNVSGKLKRLTLQDGSEIMLSDKSEVSFEEPFTGNRRDIILKGKAAFKVAKDKTKPFTVYSLDLMTTALGTHFTISAFENADNIYVRLYEGKIVVKSSASVKTKLKDDYYLLPGQQLIYNNKKYKARLLNFSVKNAESQAGNRNENVTDNIELPENKKGYWYMFNNESLEQVLDHLEVLYNTDIVYSKKDVRKRYFIGQFDKSDSLSNILFQIATLNNFKVTKKDNKFIITK